MKTAIIYDWIDSEGGIERVLPILIKSFNNPDIYTSYIDLNKAKWAKNLKIKTSFIQNFPDFIKKNRVMSMIFYTYAFESFNFNNYDLVISVSSSFAKSVITKPETIHINYMLTPTRYFWIDKNSYFENPILKFIGKILLSNLKKWDYVAAQRPDSIITLSESVYRKIKKYYKRSSTVIYPPFDFNYWNKIKKGFKNEAFNYKNYYLLVSRLEPYKKVDLAIKAFNKLNKKLIVIGTGSLLNKLKRMANKNIEFKQNIKDEELAIFYSNANALIMPQTEEFGLVSLESQFFGCPIISYIKSGVCETTEKNKTAIFFNKQTTKDLIKAVVRFESMSYNLKKLTKKLDQSYFFKFDTNIFINKIKNHIDYIIKSRNITF